MPITKELSTCVDEITITYDPNTEKISANLPDPGSEMPTMVSKTAGSVGTSLDYARADHSHEAVTGTPVALTPGGSNAQGNSSSLARANHVHSLPAFGTTAGTFAQGNDARFTGDRIASDLRSATSVVNVSTAAAPAAGQGLVSTGSTQALWQSPGGDLGGTYTSTTVARARGLKSATTDVEVASAAAPVAGRALVAVSSTQAQWGFPSLQQVTISSGVSSTAAVNTLYSLQVGTYTLTLPSSHSAGNTIIVKGSLATLAQTIAAAGGQTIDGASQVVLTVPWQAVTLVSTGTNWIRTSFDREPQYVLYNFGGGSVSVRSNTIYQIDNNGDFTVNLPSQHVAGDRIVIKRPSNRAGNYTYTITPAGVQTIDGAASVGLRSAGQVCELVSTGTNWLRIDDFAISALNYPQLGISDPVQTNAVYLVAGTTGIYNFGLPPLATTNAGDVMIFKITSGKSEANPVINLNGNGADLIDGAATLSLWQTGDVATLVASAGGWRLLNVPKPPIKDPFTNFTWASNAATINVGLARNFIATNTLTGNSTLTMSDGLDGAYGIIYVKQDATGSRTLTFTVSGRTTLKDSGVSDLNPSPTANSTTQYQYQYVTVAGTAYVMFRKFFLA